MESLIERALAAEIEKFHAQPVWQPTDEFIIHGDVMINTDVDADIAQMYEEMMANDFMSVPEEQWWEQHENNCWDTRPINGRG